MKNRLLPALSFRPFWFLSALFLATPALKAQILFFDFNKMSGTPSESVSTGTSPLTEVNKTLAPAGKEKKKAEKYRSKSGEGVTGQQGDYALDFRSVEMMGRDGEGPAAVVSEAHGPMAGLKSFTLCGWFRVDEKVGYAARLMEMYNPSTQGFFFACDDEGNLAFEVNKHRVVSKGLDYTITGTWVFFAVAFNGIETKQNVTFALGTAEKGISFVTLDLAVPEPLPIEGGTLTIGNSGGYQRPIKGLMDEVGVHGSATDGSGRLSEQQLKELFQATVARMKP